MKVLITQSNYIPWKGYFDSIRHCDVFVVYDDVQYTKRDWRNRNKIKTPSGLKWLSIPVIVKGKYFQKIKDTIIADESWTRTHWNILEQNYRKSAFFKEMAEWIEPLYKNCNLKYLSDINIYFIEEINKFFGIDTKIRLSSEFNLDDDKTERLVNICKKLKATDYYSGPSAKNYIKEEEFENNKIKLHYWDYSGYREYPQLYPPFEHSVSVLDLIFNMGRESTKFLKF